MTLLVAGYLGAWLGFGLVALGLVAGLNGVMSGAEWLQGYAWTWGAGLFLLAGAFQFSKLKYACLDRCRSPVGFLNAHWHGRSPARESFNIGFQHGVFCVGCCWALMLLMFAVGTASLAWMLVLAIIMAVEKNLPWGRRAGRPVGAVLLGIGFLIAAYQAGV
jgi:predicted metal-binding membrane protein